ncbi:hypothetical protein Tco_0024604 [Tanacetum coccineum]
MQWHERKRLCFDAYSISGAKTLRSSDVEDSPVHDRFANVEGMHAVPPPMTGNYMPSGPDRENTLESVPEPVGVVPNVDNPAKRLRTKEFSDSGKVPGTQDGNKYYLESLDALKQHVQFNLENLFSSGVVLCLFNCKGHSDESNKWHRSVRSGNKLQNAGPKKKLILVQVKSSEANDEGEKEELLQFKIQEVWILVDLVLIGKKAIGTNGFTENKKGISVPKEGLLGVKVCRLHYAPRPEILKKFNFASVKTANTLIETQKLLTKDEEAADVDVYLYRSMIGSLMYLTASRPDIMFAVCACSRFHVTPKTSHLNDVKRILSKNLEEEIPQQEVVNFLAGDLFHGNARSRQSWLLILQRQSMLLLPTAMDSVLIGMKTEAKLVLPGKVGAARQKFVLLVTVTTVGRVVVTEASIKSFILLLHDVDGTACLTNEAIFQNLALMGNLDTSKKKKFLMYQIFNGFFEYQMELGEHFNDVVMLHQLTLAKGFLNMSREKVAPVLHSPADSYRPARQASLRKKEDTRKIEASRKENIRDSPQRSVRFEVDHTPELDLIKKFNDGISKDLWVVTNTLSESKVMWKNQAKKLNNEEEERRMVKILSNRRRRKKGISTYKGKLLRGMFGFEIDSLDIEMVAEDTEMCQDEEAKGRIVGFQKFLQLRAATYTSYYC